MLSEAGGEVDGVDGMEVCCENTSTLAGFMMLDMMLNSSANTGLLAPRTTLLHNLPPCRRCLNNTLPPARLSLTPPPSSPLPLFPSPTPCGGGEIKPGGARRNTEVKLVRTS